MVAKIFKELRRQHETAVVELALSPAYRSELNARVDHLFRECEEQCKEAAFRRELSLAAIDSISSLGERLSAPLVGAALAEHGVAIEVIESTELIVTDSSHGAAEPRMEWTRERCQARLLPLVSQSIVPVVTGFIGATLQGAPTTLGRGGSDYSATIVGSAMDAGEVMIWTDVDGVLTADPRLVADARTIPELSHREATELAYFGAKVLHPKTLLPLMRSETPVWIRNTFAPERRGTKITPHGIRDGGGVKALTSNSDIALIRLRGRAIADVPDVSDRVLESAARVASDALLISRPASRCEVCCVIPSKFANLAVEALRSAFAQELACGKVSHVILDQAVALVTMVGQKLCDTAGIVGRLQDSLHCENLKILGTILPLIGAHQLSLREDVLFHRALDLLLGRSAGCERSARHCSSGAPPWPFELTYVPPSTRRKRYIRRVFSALKTNCDTALRPCANSPASSNFSLPAASFGGRLPIPDVEKIDSIPQNPFPPAFLVSERRQPFLSVQRNL
jgi:aspartate kinase